MEYFLREMTIDDIPAVIEGETKAFGESLGYDMLYTDLTLNPFSHYIVLIVDEKVHGYISFWVSDSADILNFYVDEEYRGYHFGDELLEFVFDVCVASNINIISLEVRETNEVAKNLYKKHGFIEDHVRENYYNDGENALVMIKKFGEDK